MTDASARLPSPRLEPLLYEAWGAYCAYLEFQEEHDEDAATLTAPEFLWRWLESHGVRAGIPEGAPDVTQSLFGPYVERERGAIYDAIVKHVESPIRANPFVLTRGPGASALSQDIAITLYAGRASLSPSQGAPLPQGLTDDRIPPGRDEAMARTDQLGGVSDRDAPNSRTITAIVQELRRALRAGIPEGAPTYADNRGVIGALQDVQAGTPRCDFDCSFCRDEQNDRGVAPPQGSAPDTWEREVFDWLVACAERAQRVLAKDYPSGAIATDLQVALMKAKEVQQFRGLRPQGEAPPSSPEEPGELVAATIALLNASTALLKASDIHEGEVWLPVWQNLLDATIRLRNAVGHAGNVDANATYAERMKSALRDLVAMTWDFLEGCATREQLSEAVVRARRRLEA